MTNEELAAEIAQLKERIDKVEAWVEKINNFLLTIQRSFERQLEEEQGRKSRIPRPTA